MARAHQNLMKTFTTDGTCGQETKSAFGSAAVSRRLTTTESFEPTSFKQMSFGRLLINY